MMRLLIVSYSVNEEMRKCQTTHTMTSYNFINMLLHDYHVI